MDLLYFGLRLVLSGFVAAAAWAALRFAWRGSPIGGVLGVAIGGSLLLAVATALSIFDAIDNFVLRPKRRRRWQTEDKLRIVRETLTSGVAAKAVADRHGISTAVLRPACRPSGRQIVKWLRRLIAALRTHWPRVEIMLRGDSHYCAPEVLRFCRANRLDYTLGVAPTSTLRKHIAGLEQSTAARRPAAGGEKLRRFKEFYDGAASWDRAERIIARVEAGPDGVDTRFIVTNLSGGSARTLYEDVYCARGQSENHIKAWKTHLAADRTSCCRAGANQMRLFLHVGAYWLMWSLRSLVPRRSRWRVAQFDTLRLRLIKIAARVEVLTRQVRLHLPRATPDQAILVLMLSRLSRLVV